MTEDKGFAFPIAQSLRWDFRFRDERKYGSAPPRRSGIFKKLPAFSAAPRENNLSPN